MLFVYWFRKDLRLLDNRALSEFVKDITSSDRFLLVYIKNKNSFKYFGSRRITFLLESIQDLRKELKKFNLNLQVYEGTSLDIFKRILNKYPEVSLYINEQVEPYCIKRDKEIKELIEKGGGQFNSFTDTTIFKLGEIKNSAGSQYKVYTAFKNYALSILTDKNYLMHEVDLSILDNGNEVAVTDLKTLNVIKEFKNLESSKSIKGGRTEGLRSLKDFYQTGLHQYKSKRNFPSVKGTSQLSPHLHFGTISIREAYRTANSKLQKSKTENQKTEIETWIDELLWREFYYNITFHFPHVIHKSFNNEFDKVKWNNDEAFFKRWCEGKTGYPIVDAGMRQLNEEGWLHNRVRMIVAMFLTKDLLIDWRLGEKYFAEKLIDLDFSNNNGGWQWSASTGVDAQPYFRVFNPVLQSKKFDANGEFIKKYVPELGHLPAELIHEPHLMSETEQKKYKVKIGKDYPVRIVDHKRARNITIKRYSEAAGKIKFCIE